MKLVTLITLALVAVIAYAFFTAVSVFGLGHNSHYDLSSYGCKPYTRGMVLHGQSAAMTQGNCNGTGKAQGSEDSVTPSVIPPTITPPNTSIVPTVPSEPVVIMPTLPNPEPSPEPSTDKVKHCNNGEGNGAEGCSPANSDHANNDENDTTPKEEHNR